MAQFSKFKLLFALKLNLIGGQFYREISKFGNFINLKIIIKLFKFQQSKSWTIAMEI